MIAGVPIPKSWFFGLALAVFVCAPTPSSANPSSPLPELLLAFEHAFVGPMSPEAGTDLCPTLLLSDLRARWTELSPAERHHVDWHSNPFYRDWVDQGGMTWEQGDVLALRQASRETCFDPMDIDWSLGGTDQETESDNFKIFWSLDGMTSPLAIDQLLTDLEDALSHLIDVQGFLPPNQLSDYQMVVATQWMDSNTIAYTAVEGCGSLDYMDYIVVNQRYLSAPDQIRSTMAHELFHTIQRRYGYQEYVLGASTTPNRWWLEASAVYSERMTVPEAPQPVIDQATRWAQDSWKSMLTYDEAGHQYGMVVWALALETSIGGTEWHRLFWEHLQDKTDYLLRDEFDSFFESGGYGTDFLDQYRTFLGIAATADFAYEADFVGLRELGAALSTANGTTKEHSPGEFPLQVDIPADNTPPAPEYLGANYIWFEPADHSGEEALYLSVEGPDSIGTQSVEWVFEAVAVADGKVSAQHSFSLEQDREEGVYRGEILLARFLSDYQGLYLVASPISDINDERAPFSYSARLREGVEGSGFVSVSGEEAGCACQGASLLAEPTLGQGAVTGRQPTLVLALLTLGALLRRSRGKSE